MGFDKNWQTYTVTQKVIHACVLITADPSELFEYNNLEFPVLGCLTSVYEHIKMTLTDIEIYKNNRYTEKGVIGEVPETEQMYYCHF